MQKVVENFEKFIEEQNTIIASEKVKLARQYLPENLDLASSARESKTKPGSESK